MMRALSQNGRSERRTRRRASLGTSESILQEGCEDDDGVGLGCTYTCGRATRALTEDVFVLGYNVS